MAFPLADPSSLVIANEKDVYHVQDLTRMVIDVADGLFGSHVTSLLKIELKYLSQIIYYGLTMLRGNQTLGEEYCDVHMVTPFAMISVDQDASGNNDQLGNEITTKTKKSGNVIFFQKTSFSQRLMLLILSIVVPYIVSRVQAGGWLPLMSIIRRETAQNRANALRARLQQQQQQMSAARHEDDSNSYDEQVRGVGIVQAKTWLQSILERIKGLIPSLGGLAFLWTNFHRLHLAAFYMGGPFLSVSRRLANVWYIFTREPQSENPSFGVLGYFIVLQFVLQLSIRSLQLVRSLISAGLSRATETAKEEEELSNRKKRELDELIPSLPENGQVSSAYSNSRCGICLSNMTNPSCPPCGHLYCYQCIQEAVATSSNCPHCRLETTPQQILCIYTL